eukprot:6489119-Amphidinium_carterae.1
MNSEKNETVIMCNVIIFGWTVSLRTHLAAPPNKVFPEGNAARSSALARRHFSLNSQASVIKTQK